MDKRAIHRTLDLVVGLPLLLLGACAIFIDIHSWISNALNQDPNLRIVTTFPVGTIFGVPHFWFGCHLVFRTSGLLLVHRLIVRLRRVKAAAPTADAAPKSN